MGVFSARKGVAAAAVAATVAVGAGGVAYAYFTASGSGNGSVKVGDSLPLTVTVSNQTTGAPGVLVPGGPGMPFTFTVQNSSPVKQAFTQTTATVSAVTKAAGAPAGTCDAAWFTANVNPVPAAVLAPGASVNGGGIVTLTETDSNQDACKSASVTVKVDVS